MSEAAARRAQPVEPVMIFAAKDAKDREEKKLSF